jgi:hypothetical protein
MEIKMEKISEMDYQKALTNVVNGTGDHTANIQIIFDVVRSLCQTQTEFDGSETELWDWLYQGQLSASDTPENLAADWDEYQISSQEV